MNTNETEYETAKERDLRISRIANINSAIAPASIVELCSEETGYPSELYYNSSDGRFNFAYTPKLFDVNELLQAIEANAHDRGENSLRREIKNAKQLIDSLIN